MAKTRKLPVCVKCSQPIRQAGARGVSDWINLGNGKGQHIVCPR